MCSLLHAYIVKTGFHGKSDALTETRTRNRLFQSDFFFIFAVFPDFLKAKIAVGRVFRQLYCSLHIM